MSDGAEPESPAAGAASRRVRLRDVAALAGVDPSTASRALSGNAERVHPQTARRVHAASRQLGYIPNAFARGLRTRTTRSIGVILPDFTNPVYARVISGIERRAGESAISVVVRALHGDDLDRHADLAWESRVDGLLFGALSEGSNAIVQLEEAGVPCVLINRSSPEAKASVVLDEAAGVRMGLEYLLGFGHRRIAFVSGPGAMDTARRRRLGFVEAGAALGLSLDERLIVEAADPEAARRVVAALLAVEPAPTAVFAWTTHTALGVLHGLHELGRRIPEDISVIAMQDAWVAEYTWPPLTGVEMPVELMGERAVDLLLAMVNGSRPERILIASPPPRIVERASVGAPPV